MNRVAVTLVLALLGVGMFVVFGGQNGLPGLPSGMPDARSAVRDALNAGAVDQQPAPAPKVAPGTWPPTPIPAGYRIQIPHVSIDLAIAEGELVRDTVRGATPEGYAFHLPGTAIPGTGGSSYIYSHARRGMFLTLWEVSLGDEVRIPTPDGRILRYVVSEIYPRVDPRDVSWLRQDLTERLTLQTSTGPTANDPRFIVIAVPK